MQQNLEILGEKIYKKKEREWKEKYNGKVIAIDVETGEICGSGKNLKEAGLEAHRKYPERHFYFKKVGSSHTAHFYK